MITKELLDAILDQYAQDAHGRHGIIHWARVLEIGRRLCGQQPAKRHVVELFSVFHDSRRITEKQDHGHGARGADLAAAMRGKYYDLNDEDFTLLYDACVRHTDGETRADITIQTCWDSDRLDLGRVRIIPNPEYLCTDAAKEQAIIDWAYQRSITNYAPSLIQQEWGL